MKKGDVINICTYRGIVEDTVVSIGRKYITTKKYKFYVDTLREVNGAGVSAYIIEDLEQFERNILRRKYITDIQFFSRNALIRLSDEDLKKVSLIFDKYK